MSATFLSEIVAYLKTRTDAPPDFHIHAGMTALSIALGNRVWCDGWSDDLFPNVWIVLIAPSGYGKSVPLHMATSLLERAGLGEHVLPNSFSLEQLLTILQGRPVGVFLPQEFAAFLGMLGRDYNASAMETLTELYDVPPTYRRELRSGAYRLARPCLTILGASSPAWFAQQYRGSMLAGGFLARFLFVPSRDTGPALDHPGPRNQPVENRLAGHLAEARKLAGPVDFSAAWEAFNTWTRATREENRRACPAEFEGMRSRAPALVLKTAMLFMASRDPSMVRVQERDVKNAIAYVTRCHALAERFLTEEVPRNQADADRLKLLDLVRRSGGRLGWSPALRASHLSGDVFRRAVETLADADQVRVERIGKGGSRELVLGAAEHRNGTA